MDEERRQDQTGTPWDSPTPEENGEYHFSADQIPHDDAATTDDSTATDALYTDIDVQAIKVEEASGDDAAGNSSAEAASHEKKESSEQGHYYTQVKEVGKGSGKRKVGIICSIIVGLVLVALIGFGGGLLAADKIEDRLANNLDQMLQASGSTVLYRSVETTGDNVDDREDLSISDVAALCADSVVEIATETTVNSWGLFGNSSYLVPGAGSGIIISDTGHILTCAHVIEDAQTIAVRLRNGESYEATVVAADEESDVAIIKIEPTSELTPAVFGSSDDLQVGDSVVAIGNPLGELGGSVTEGIISAMDREVTIQNKGTFTVLQTSAAINSGNSGGGLFNRQGELIGMVNAKASEVGVEGLGFALPIDEISDIIEDLLNYGYVTDRGVTLGVVMVDINDERTAISYGVDQYGCYIYQVNADSNAAYAGLRAGDRIISIDGEAIDDGDEVVEIISNHKANDQITMVIERNGREIEMDITLYGSVPNDATATALS